MANIDAAFGLKPLKMLGAGTNSNGVMNFKIQLAGTTWKQTAHGQYYLYATKTDGTLWYSGEGGEGQAGQNNRTQYSSPVQVGSGTDWATGMRSIAGGAGFGKSVTIGENLTIHGNFTVDGTTTTVNSSTVTIDDAALKLADNQGDTNTFTDSADFGFYGEYGNTSSLFYSGIFRDASANVFVVVNSIGTEPGATVSYNAANSTNSGNLGQLDAIIDGGSY